MNQSINTDSKNSKEPQQKYRLWTVSIKILGGLNRFYGRPTSPSASIMAQNIQLFGPRGGFLTHQWVKTCFKENRLKTTFFNKYHAIRYSNFNKCTFLSVFVERYCFPVQNHLSRLVTKPTKWSVRPAKTPPSLIRVFAVHMKKAWVLSYPLSAQRRLWSDWANAQADLSLRWAHTHFVGFVMSWLIWTIFPGQKKLSPTCIFP